jgi:hypothetical protein
MIDISILCVLSWFISVDKNSPSYNINEARYFLMYVSISVAIGGFIFILYEFVRFFLRE